MVPLSCKRVDFTIGWGSVTPKIGLRKGLTYNDPVFQLSGVNAVGIVDGSVVLNDSNALGSCSVQVTAAVETHVTKALSVVIHSWEKAQILYWSSKSGVGYIPER